MQYRNLRLLTDQELRAYGYGITKDGSWGADEPMYFHDQTQQVVRAAIKNGRADGLAVYLITAKPGALPVGHLILRRDGVERHSYHLGFWVHPAYRGQRLASRAVGRLIRHRRYWPPQINRIVAITASSNQAAAKVLRQNKFIPIQHNESLGICTYELQLATRKPLPPVERDLRER